MSYKITEEGNIATVHLDGEIDMDVTEKAKEVIMPLIEAKKEVHLNLKEVGLDQEIQKLQTWQRQATTDNFMLSNQTYRFNGIAGLLSFVIN